MMRLFNAREGFGRKQDILPDRMFIPIPDGPNAGVGINKEDFEKALDAYYDYAGWDKKTGVPTKETVKRLDLEWVAI
jgi:aldehyde:ferredoxin oxidoreductase